MSEDLGFNYDELYYIETRSLEDKRPQHKWGGYGQDFDDARYIHTHDEITESNAESWAIVGIEDKPHMGRSLLVFDLDIYKADDDFDITKLGVPANMPIVKTQSGGLYAFCFVHEERGTGAESDFKMLQSLSWDIDIRGSFVSHHVRAPADIPGVGGDYELVDDKPIPGYTDPADTVQEFTYDGKPLLEYDTRGRGSGFDFDRETEPPENMPTCYHAGLELRAANPDTEDAPNLNTHKVNVLTGLCGVAAGYSIDQMVEHLCEDYAPGENADTEETRYQLEHMAQKMDRGEYSPPSISTLQDYGILDEDEDCDCSIPYHGGDPDNAQIRGQEMWEWWSEARVNGNLGPDSIIPDPALRYIAESKGFYDFDVLPDDVDELPAVANNRALAWVQNRWWDVDDDEPATKRQYKARDPDSVYSWQGVQYIYEDDTEPARQAAENLLRSKYDFITNPATEELLVYDNETGVYTDRLAPILGEIHEGLGQHWSTHELNEIKARLKQQNIVEPRTFNGRGQFDDPHICVENGVLNLFTRELKPHDPSYYFTERVPVEYDPAASPETYEEFMDDLTGRAVDADAMMEMVGHALIPDANERYKKFLILYGDADNGKTMFYKLVVALLQGPNNEEKNVANVKLNKISQNQFSKDSIYGNMANIAGEIDGKKIRNTAELKDITGGDPVEIEPKGGKSFFDTINATVMFAANDPPIIGERDKHAIATRIVPVELPYVFEHIPTEPHHKQRVPESELEAILLTEEARSGFLNLALDGIERLEENGGDVSLPESPEERLKKYEKQADPMKEFGHECLTNDEDSYLVKADITTIFKTFAAANGYEVGSNIASTLHGVLRNMQDLNYTDSYPRSPNYSDTDLPLRGWKERKTVVNRVTLTENGLKYAEEAGLVVDEDEEEQEVEEQTSATSVSALEPGRHDIQVEVASVLDPKPWLQAEGTFRDNTGLIDYVARDTTSGNPASELEEGNQYHIKDALVKNDENGIQHVELRGTEAITHVKDGAPLGRQSSLKEAKSETVTTDGGDEIPEDATGPLAHAERLRLALKNAGKPMSRTELKSTAGAQLDLSPDEADAGIEKGLQKGLIMKDGDELTST